MASVYAHKGTLVTSDREHIVLHMASVSASNNAYGSQSYVPAAMVPCRKDFNSQMVW